MFLILILVSILILHNTFLKTHPHHLHTYIIFPNGLQNAFRTFPGGIMDDDNHAR